MDVEIDDDDLRRLLDDDSHDAAHPKGVAKAFRRRVIDILAAKDERDFYAFRYWHFEKLSGNRDHQRSIRLNDQWRLILEIEKGNPGNIIHIIAIEDYH